MSRYEPPEEVKVVVLGSGGVGKTALVTRFIFDQFDDDFFSNRKEYTFRKQILFDESVCLVDVFDTAGQEEYQCLWDSWIRMGDAFIFCYSVASPESFEELSPLIHNCKRSFGPHRFIAPLRCLRMQMRSLPEPKLLARKRVEPESTRHFTRVQEVAKKIEERRKTRKRRRRSEGFQQTPE